MLLWQMQYGPVSEVRGPLSQGVQQRDRDRITAIPASEIVPVQLGLRPPLRLCGLADHLFLGVTVS